MGRRRRATPTSRPETNTATSLAAVFALLFAIGLAIYWRALNGPFIWDDEVLLGSGVRSLRGLGRSWLGGQADYQPATTSFLWIQWHLWGSHPAGYRLMNLALHAGSAAMLVGCLRSLRVRGAFATAFIFLVHPVCVGTVAWIAEVKNTLSLFLAMTSLYFFIRSSNSGVRQKAVYYWVSILLFASALLSKISVVTLPFVFAGLSWVMARRKTGNNEPGKGILGPDTLRTVVWQTAPLFALSLVTGLLSIWFQRHHAMASMAENEGEPLGGRLALGGKALWFYLGKAVVPINLMPIYPRWRVTGNGFFGWLAGLAWVGVLIFLASLFKMQEESDRWNKMVRALFFGLCFFSVTLVPVLGPIQISYFFISRVADHLQYLPLIGIAAAAGFILGDIPLRDIGRPRALLLLAIATGLAILSGRRSALFARPEDLWRDNIVRNPPAAMAWANLGETLQEKDSSEALNAFAESLRLDPRNRAVQEKFAGSLFLSGKLEDAISEYRKLLAEQAGNPRAHLGLGASLARKGLLEEAGAEFRTTIELAPDLAEAHRDLGGYYLYKRQWDEAISEFQIALRLAPEMEQARRALATAQAQKASIKGPPG